MSQLDRIETMLTELLELHRRDDLSERMAKAMEQVAEIQRAQQLAAIPTSPAEVPQEAPDPTKDPPDKPQTIVPEPEAKHPDKFGGAQGVKVGKPDPASPGDFIDVPYWEKGREPRPVELQVRRVRRK